MLDSIVHSDQGRANVVRVGVSSVKKMVCGGRRGKSEDEEEVEWRTLRQANVLANTN